MSPIDFLLAGTRRLPLHGDLIKAEPRKLRYRLRHTAAHMASIERRTQLRIAQPGLVPQPWPPWPHLATLPDV